LQQKKRTEGGKKERPGETPVKICRVKRQKRKKKARPTLRIFQTKEKLRKRKKKRTETERNLHIERSTQCEGWSKRGAQVTFPTAGGEKKRENPKKKGPLRCKTKKNAKDPSLGRPRAGGRSREGTKTD